MVYNTIISTRPTETFRFVVAVILETLVHCAQNDEYKIINCK